MTVVGLLHPGAMGAALGEQLHGRGVTARWCTEGRSRATSARAEAAGLEPVASLRLLVAGCSVLLSVCPPAASEKVAEQVAEFDFGGIYVEANPLAPARVQRIAALLPRASVIDGGIVGSPPASGKTTWLYLAGQHEATAAVAGLFAATAVRTRILGGEIGSASALKLSYSAFQKSSRVLAALAYASAVDHGVGDELLEIAGRRQGSYLSDIEYIPRTLARGWRWGPELDEAAALLESGGLDGDALRSLADLLDGWTERKDGALSVAEAMESLHGNMPNEPSTSNR